MKYLLLNEEKARELAKKQQQEADRLYLDAYLDKQVCKEYEEYLDKYDIGGYDEYI